MDFNFQSNSGEFFFETLCSMDCFLVKINKTLNILLSKMEIKMGAARFYR